MMCSPALYNSSSEQPLSAGHRKQRADTESARRLAEDRNVARITAESGDILLHPRECGNLIEQAEIGDSIAKIKKTLGPDTVIDRHADDAVTGKAAAVIPRRGASCVIL